MLCRNPFVPKAGQAFGCGQCLPCRITRRRIWTHRIMLELTQHKESAFVTLTYSNEHLPDNGSLRPRDLQLWLKRIRKWSAGRGQALRFYGVGEYGDTNWRPHYHVALFGYPPCDYGQTRRFPGNPYRTCCPKCETIATTWGKGRIDLARLERDSAQYVCGYVTKKLTKADDPLLEGRHPEFSRQSRKPGIGGDFMWDLADVQLVYASDAPEVVTGIRHGSVIYPLGRYLTRRLRKFSGREEGPSEFTQLQQAAKLFDLYEAASLSPAQKKEFFRSMVLEKFNKQSEALERKWKIRHRKRDVT